MRIAVYLPEKTVRAWETTPLCMNRDSFGDFSFRMNLDGCKLLVWKNERDEWFMKKKRGFFGKAEAMKITQEQAAELLMLKERIIPCVCYDADRFSVSVREEKDIEEKNISVSVRKENEG